MRHTSTVIRATLALLLGSLLAVPTAAAATPDSAQRQIIDLGTLGGQFTISEALAVNDRGQVVGDSITAGLGPEHAFLWANGTMRDLGTLGGLTSIATDINNHGQVVGVSATATGQAQHAFLWTHGRMRDLGLAAFATANDVNDRGQITGGVPLAEAFHAFRLQRGHLVDLDSAEVPYSEGMAINEGGQVAGNSAPAAAATNHAFLWSRGQRIDLGTLGGDFSSASGLNDHGAVVGQSTTAAGGGRGFVWRHGTMIDLGVLVADAMNGSRANDINNHGWIVGGQRRRRRRLPRRALALTCLRGPRRGALGPSSRGRRDLSGDLGQVISMSMARMLR
jgi:probable HAF family extracellular repeat protein